MKPHIYSIAKLAAVNVHFGIAPHYRGSHTLFYPLYLGDYENVGVTLHFLDPGVDTGDIIAQAYPSLDVDDTEATVLAKCARLAGELVLEFCGAMQERPISGRRQEPAGRLIRHRDRKPWHDAHYVLKRRLLRHRVPRRSERVMRYYGSARAEEHAGVRAPA